jgi:hypothetical protein
MVKSKSKPKTKSSFSAHESYLDRELTACPNCDAQVALVETDDGYQFWDCVGCGERYLYKLPLHYDDHYLTSREALILGDPQGSTLNPRTSLHSKSKSPESKESQTNSHGQECSECGGTCLKVGSRVTLNLSCQRIIQDRLDVLSQENKQRFKETKALDDSLRDCWIRMTKSEENVSQLQETITHRLDNHAKIIEGLVVLENEHTEHDHKEIEADVADLRKKLGYMHEDLRKKQAIGACLSCNDLSCKRCTRRPPTHDERLV